MCGLDVLLILMNTNWKQAKPIINPKLDPDMESRVSVGDQYNMFLIDIVCSVCTWL